MSDVLTRLWQVVKERRQADPSESYVAALHDKGLNKILEKVGEEATEVIIAAKDHRTKGRELAGDHSDNNGSDHNGAALIKEVADLWFHSLVLLDHVNASPDEVFAELERRFGTSGIAEKRARQGNK